MKTFVLNLKKKYIYQNSKLSSCSGLSSFFSQQNKENTVHGLLLFMKSRFQDNWHMGTRNQLPKMRLFWFFPNSDEDRRSTLEIFFRNSINSKHSNRTKHQKIRWPSKFRWVAKSSVGSTSKDDFFYQANLAMTIKIVKQSLVNKYFASA